MTRLHLIRHGPTHAKSMVGWSDLPADLSDTDLLARLSGHLPQDALVVSSDLIRAADTASAIQGDRHRLPHRAGLREINFGAWELRRYAEIEAEDPAHIAAFWQEPGEVRAPGGESWNELLARIGAAMARLPDDAPEVIVVCHFGAIVGAMQLCLGLTTQQAFSHRIDNLSVTSLSRSDASGAGWCAERINHIP